MPKKESNSRPARWARAVEEAQSARSEIEAAVERYNAALSELTDLKSEYEEWQGNLPENLQGSALAEKLQAVCDLDFSDIECPDFDALDEAEGIDLPRGFGKD